MSDVAIKEAVEAMEKWIKEKKLVETKVDAINGNSKNVFYSKLREIVPYFTEDVINILSHLKKDVGESRFVLVVIFLLNFLAMPLFLILYAIVALLLHLDIISKQVVDNFIGIFIGKERFKQLPKLDFAEIQRLIRKFFLFEAQLERSLEEYLIMYCEKQSIPYNFRVEMWRILKSFYVFRLNTVEKLISSDFSASDKYFIASRTTIVGIPAHIRKFKCFVTNHMRDRLEVCCKEVIKDLLAIKERETENLKIMHADLQNIDDNLIEKYNRGDEPENEEEKINLENLRILKLNQENSTTLSRIMSLGKFIDFTNILFV